MHMTILDRSSHMSIGPAAVVDALNSLLEAETASLLRFMGEGYPYLSRTTAEVRQPLQEMIRRREERTIALAELIESLGGVPDTQPPAIDPEEQYLAFLSLKFLLPKLIDAMRLLLERYENAIRALKGADPQVLETLEQFAQEHRHGLNLLEKASAAQVHAK
jgi:hypothetical protein